MIPTLCIATAVVAGVLELPFRRFLPALALGGLLHLIVMVGLGYLLGPRVLALVARLHPPLGLLTSAVLLILMTYWIVKAERGVHATSPARRPGLANRLQAGLLAGLVAGLESSLAMTTLLGLLGLTVAAPAVDAQGLRGMLEQMLTPLVGSITAPGLPMLVLWGAAYGIAVEHELPGPYWLRGVIFALVPMLVALYAIFPLATWGLLGSTTADQWSPTILEVFRHLVYGLTLGSAYPMMLRQRPESNGESDETVSATA
jgi:hypothetical protein